MANPEADEWEYEYDENETEDFYLTLDLSNMPTKDNNSTTTGFIRPSLIGHPILLQSRLRALNAARRTQEVVMGLLDVGESASMGAMQIIGLHTSNPLIMYNDIFFVKPNPDAEPENKPLCSLPSVDLLAMSSTRLMATTARLRPRDEVIENVTLPEEPAVTSVDLSKDPRQDVEIPGTPSAQATQDTTIGPLSASNGFLARLNQAKAKRGDRTRLMASTTPEGVRLVSAPEEEQPASMHATPETVTEDTVMGGIDDQPQT